MDELLTNRPALSLYELNTIIKSALNDTFPDTCWVIAEIADAKTNQRGHCYLELVEKEDDKTVAQVKATIWAYDYRKLIQKFQKATNESLRPGMKILFLASVTFHEVYGLSLNVKDIDPAYTMGEMALKKKEIIERLRKEGLLDLNKELALPLVPQKVAVISSPTAAGYSDFFNQLDNNAYGYKFMHLLFPALMQGAEAEKSIIAALDNIKKRHNLFDVAVIIRGGGSAIDLNCFDSYELAAQIARFPIPVITGIGHEKDDTITDMTAHTKMKTPTAVAEFLISGVRCFEEQIVQMQHSFIAGTEKILKDNVHALSYLAQRLSFVPGKIIAAYQHKLLMLQRDIKSNILGFVQKEDNRLNKLEQAIRLLDPSNVLKRGYSITRLNGKIIKDAGSIKDGSVISTLLNNGTITSVVKKPKETKESEQRKADYLLPGFD